MNEPEARFEELLSILREKGFRMTPQRLEVIRLLAASKGHPSASQIFETIKKQFPTMSQATVYNTLAVLKDLNQVLEIDLHGDSHYDGNRPEEHAHLICLNCKKIIDGDFKIETERVQELEQSSRFQIIRSQITFYGLCPECRSSN